MNNRAEKLAAALDSRVVRNWVHSTGTSPKATGFKHDAECQQAAALIRRQAEQIRELRELIDGVLKIGRGTSGRIILEGWHEETLRAALSNTKESKT